MRFCFALIALVLLGGCTQPTQPTVITNTNTNSNILNGGGGLTDPNAVAGQCLLSEQVPIRVDLNVPLTAPVGGAAGIDATPKSASGKRSDACNILQGIFWSASPVDVCSVPNPSEFNTNMKCAKAGSCQLTATVPGRGASGTASVSCQ